MKPDDDITGRPDETWSEKQRAEYEALKAKWLAEMPDEAFWLNEPMVPIDDLIELLDRYEAQSKNRDDNS